MKPIPKSLLIHSATAVEKGAPDLWGNRADEKRTRLSRIRIEPSSALSLSKSNEQIRLAAILFYDCRNSCPAGYDFSHTDKIEIGKKQYDIVNVQTLYDERRLHHLEVELCL